MLSKHEWRKAAASGAYECVEVAMDADGVRVRDSKHPDQPALWFTRTEWEAFLMGVRYENTFDLPDPDPAPGAGPPRPLYPELADDLKRAGQQRARHAAAGPPATPGSVR